MTVPENTKIYEGQIATYWFDQEILVASSKSTLRTVESISDNIALVKKITGNKRVPLLIYLKNSPIPDKETRKFSSEQIPNIYSAMAMVSRPGLAKFIMNILFSIKPPPIPMKSFTDDKAAKKWLKSFI